MPTIPSTEPVIQGNLSPRGSLPTKSLYDPVTQTGPGQIAFDPSSLDSSDAKRTEIIDYIRLRLGDGLVDVETEKAHYEMGIKQALVKYRQRASNSTEESYAFLDLLPETQEYILPPEVQVVKAVYRRGIGSVTGTTASQFEPFAAGYLNTYMLTAGRVGGLLNYELFVDYQKLSMRMFGGIMNFHFNPTTKKLTLIRKMPFKYATANETESVMLHIYNVKPDQMILNDTYAFPWIQEYAYSFTKFTLGEARSKFGNLPGPQGGTTMNGDTLKAEAQAEMEKLEDDLKNFVDGSMPLSWVIG